MTMSRKRPAHVYRHEFHNDDIPNPAHAAVVLCRGPWVVVYWDNGWHQWRDGFNMLGEAVADAEYLAGEGNVVVHERQVA